MQSNTPFSISEVTNLTNYGLQKEHFRFGVLAMESDKYITVKEPMTENTQQGTNLFTIEPLNNFKVTKKTNKSEAALMNPDSPVIALKAKVDDSGEKFIIQIWQTEPQQKLKVVEVNEPIVYWHWLNAQKLGIVTASNAYYTNISKENEGLIKIVERAGALAESCQVIGFQLDNTERWGLLTAISSPDGGKTINGHMQLCLIDQGKSQAIEGHCATFGSIYYHSPDYKSSVIAYFERKANDSTQRVWINEIGSPLEGKTKLRKSCELAMHNQFPNDFPVFMHISNKHGLLYIMTKFGFFFVLEVASCSIIYKGRISNDPVFIGARNSRTDGVLIINKSGALYQLNCDESGLAKYIASTCTHIENVNQVVNTLALHYKLPGCEGILLEQFAKAVQSGDFQEAGKIAASSPGSSIRNADTIQKLKNIPSQPGSPAPVLQYFLALLDKTKLNQVETLEIVAPLLNQGKFQHIEKWLKEDKLYVGLKLVQTIKGFDKNLANVAAEKCDDPNAKFDVLMEVGQVERALQLQGNNSNTDYMSMLKNLVLTNPEAALGVAKQAARSGTNIYNIAELFFSNGLVQQLTGFCIEVMKDNRNEDAPWQTKVLELNLNNFPQVAETILEMNVWKLYDRKKIGVLLEQKKLPQRALEHYTEYNDIRRVVLQYSANFNPEWLVNYLSKQTSEVILNLMKDLLRQNRANVPLCLQLAINNNQKLGILNVVEVFEALGIFNAVHAFLNSILGSVQDPDIYFKYIVAAARSGKFQDIEKVIRDTKYYDPAKVKDFLMEAKLQDPKPLMVLCDMHGFVDDLTKYLFTNNLFKLIEIYVLTIAPQSAPRVVGTLMDLECEERYIIALLANIRTNCPIEQLVVEFEKRNKLRLLEHWLEARVSEGNQTPALHNALAKIYIDTNKDPQSFLANNPYYESKVVGLYAAEIDPHLAMIAYKRAWGECDDELIDLTNRCKYFRVQAKYLVERRDKDLWAKVLSPDNQFRAEVIENVVATALPDSKNGEEVLACVQAFLTAKLSHELMALLEKIVYHSEFKGYNKLQNLLIITAIDNKPQKVMEYITRLDNYDAEDIAAYALDPKNSLYEEAHYIYNKKKKFPEAIDVLISYLDDIPRAASYAINVNDIQCWSRLGNAYLNKGVALEAIDCFMKSGDPNSYAQVIQLAEHSEKFEQLTKYLIMARGKIKDSMIDTELLYCLAKTNRLSELEEFINVPNSADMPRVGDRCFDDKLYEAAKAIFVRLKNNAKIASCLIKLKQFTQAFDAAKRANTPKTWKELCLACIANKEYRIANAAGMNIIVHPDHLEELIHNYELYDCIDHMIDLLEQAIATRNAHIGIFTELGVIFAKYYPEKLLEHLKRCSVTDLNVSRLLRVCERYQLWPEMVYLYSHYDEFDNAVNIMMEHSPSSWQHEQFVVLINKATNSDLYYRAVLFYLDEQPLRLNDLLKVIANKVDLTRLCQVMKNTGYVPLIVPFLKTVQNQNIAAVNEVLNQYFLEVEDHESLRASVTQYENIDQVALAKATENHELVEFRRVAAYLYRRNQKFKQSIEISIHDKQFRDAVETAQESNQPELIEELLKYFIDNEEKEFFTTTLYTCYEQLKPEMVLELSWRFVLYDFSMPYFVQLVKDLTTKVESVEKKTDQREKKIQKQEEMQMSQPPIDIYQDLGFIMPGLSNLPMLPGPGGIGGGMGYPSQQMLPGPNYGGFPSQQQQQQGGFGGGNFRY